MTYIAPIEQTVEGGGLLDKVTSFADSDCECRLLSGALKTYSLCRRRQSLGKVYSLFLDVGILFPTIT